MIYVLLIGGDVLKVHRFYIPIIGGVAITAMLAVWGLTTSLRARTMNVIAVATTILLVAVTLLSPRSFVLQYNDLEKALVRKMNFMADNMKRTDPSNFSVALSTIGAFSYRITGHKVIDLLGLTDSTVARHSEEPIPGMESTWKEAKHNSAYLLTSNPDYILFSTGIKPSAPAELALFLYPDFLESYYMIGYYYRPEGAQRGTTQSVFKRRLDISGTPRPVYAVDYVQAYKEGVEHYAARDFPGAIPYFDRAMALSPPEAHALPLYRKGICLAYAGQHLAAQRVIDSAVAIDSFLYEGHRDLLLYAIANLDQKKAIIHRDWLMRLVPWYWPHIEDRLDTDVQGDWRAFLGLSRS
jgi:tetratricopeptide (TPR) repeat protein